MFTPDQAQAARLAGIDWILSKLGSPYPALVADAAPGNPGPLVAHIQANEPDVINAILGLGLLAAWLESSLEEVGTPQAALPETPSAPRDPD